jgi:hypothetical protein
MKYINKIILVMLVLIISITGCDTDKLHELNINPQAVNEIDLNFLFTNAQIGVATGGVTGDNRYSDWRTNIGFMGPVIQHLATTAGAGGLIGNGDKYTHYFEVLQIWDFIYGGEVKLFTEILKQTDEGGYAFDPPRYQTTREAARILRAFSYMRIADYFGDAPYSEGNSGIEGIFFPKFDPAQTIYMGELANLADAAAKIGTGPDDGFSAADNMFQGDITKWKRFAYSIMLRMAMRISEVDLAAANTWVSNAVDGGVMQNNDDNVWMPMAIGPSEWRNQNGISRALDPGDGGDHSSFYLSETLMNQLQGPNKTSTADDDPRLMIFTGGIGLWTPGVWTPYETDPLLQKGMPNGMEHSDLVAIEGNPDLIEDETYSKMNVLMLDDDDPYQIMNYAEVEFLLAEAAERGIGGVSGGQGHYEAGVRAAMQQYTPFDASLDVADGAVDAYLATFPYGVTKPALEMIYDQIWINGWFNWWEAWSNWRRTGFPKLVPTSHQANITNGTIPVRLRYPGSEVATNPDNVATGVTPNEYTTKVWWDVKD